MSENSSKEIGYIVRYGGSGVINTLVGYAVIFSAMALGCSAIISNILGYAVGFFMGFVLSKKYVFRSNGQISIEAKKYAIVFVVSFAANLITLKLLLAVQVNVVFSQVLATSAFTVVMYCLTRYAVFNRGKN